MLSPALDETTVSSLVADATAAPSMHNAQPWRFHYTPDSRTLALSADLDRALPYSDPTLAGLHMGCGAALLNLRVAAVHRALLPVTALLPDPRDPSLLATVRLESAATGAEAQDDGLGSLHPAIHERHTSRQPFTDRELPEEVRCALAGAARREGAGLAFLTGPHLQFVLDLIQDAEGYNRMSPGREAELRQWTWNAKTDSPADGVPDYAFGPRKRAGRAPARDFAGAGAGAVPGRPVADFEDRPHLALLSTPEDGPADWLRAGQAMERVLLLATRHGVSGTPATQALEHPELRWLLRDPVSGTGHVQMVLRLGYGPRGPRTPRRPVRDVLTIGD